MIFDQRPVGTEEGSHRDIRVYFTIQVETSAKN